jgi:membrane protein
VEDKAPRLGAALAYYAVFSIPPLIVIVIAAIGLFYKGDVAGAIQTQIASLVGEMQRGRCWRRHSIAAKPAEF